MTKLSLPAIESEILPARGRSPPPGIRAYGSLASTVAGRIDLVAPLRTATNPLTSPTAGPMVVRMPPRRAISWVVRPEGRKWAVFRGTQSRAAALCDDQDEAIARARAMARNSAPSTLEVRNLDGYLMLIEGFERSRRGNADT